VDDASLFESARDFASLALEHHANGEQESAILNVATMLEKLTKSYLASSNPAFIAADRSFDSMLMLTGNTAFAKPGTELRTITLDEACQRTARLLPGRLPPYESLRRLIDARNGVVHAVRWRSTDVREVMVTAIAAADAILAARNTERGDFWLDYADAVDAMLDAQADAVTSTVRIKLAAASRSLAKYRIDLMAGFGGDRDSYDPREDVEQVDWYDGSMWYLNCPVCDRLQDVRGFERIHMTFDEDVEGSHFKEATIVFYPTGFACDLCRLKLDMSELPAAGVDKALEMRKITSEREAANYLEAGRALGQRFADDYTPPWCAKACGREAHEGICRLSCRTGRPEDAFCD
jgi:hypothetical protein